MDDPQMKPSKLFPPKISRQFFKCQIWKVGFRYLNRRSGKNFGKVLRSFIGNGGAGVAGFFLFHSTIRIKQNFWRVW